MCTNKSTERQAGETNNLKMTHETVGEGNTAKAQLKRKLNHI